jgi:hypothetical protein
LSPDRRRGHLSFGALQIEGAERLMDEESPPCRPDQPLHRHARAVGPQLISALAVSHRVDGAAAIELRPALAESEQRCVTRIKFKDPVLVDGDHLDVAFGIVNSNQCHIRRGECAWVIGALQNVGSDVHRQVTGFDRPSGVSPRRSSVKATSALSRFRSALVCPFGSTETRIVFGDTDASRSSTDCPAIVSG